MAPFLLKKTTDKLWLFRLMCLADIFWKTNEVANNFPKLRDFSDDTVMVIISTNVTFANLLNMSIFGRICPTQQTNTFQMTDE